MKPDTKFDKPGKSPLWIWTRVPKYADESGDKSSGGIRIDPTQVQNLGLKRKSHARNAELFSRQSRLMSVTTSISLSLCRRALLTVSSKSVSPDDWRSREERHSLSISPFLNGFEAQSEFLLLSGTGGTSTQIKGSGATSSGWYAGRGYSKAAFNPHNPDPFYH